MIKLNTNTIKTLKPTDTTVKWVFLHNIKTVEVKKEPSNRLYIIEANRLKELNKNIEDAKAALDNYSHQHQHQSILYRLRNFFRHAN